MLPKSKSAKLFIHLVWINHKQKPLQSERFLFIRNFKFWVSFHLINSNSKFEKHTFRNAVSEFKIHTSNAAFLKLIVFTSKSLRLSSRKSATTKKNCRYPPANLQQPKRSVSDLKIYFLESLFLKTKFCNLKQCFWSVNSAIWNSVSEINLKLE